MGGCENILAPYYSHANKKNPNESWINWLKKKTKNKKQSKTLVYSTSFAAEITVTKSGSLLQRAARHVLCKHVSQPNLHAKALKLRNTWTARHNTATGEHSQQSLFYTRRSVEKSTYLRAANKNPSMHFSPFLALPFMCFSPHFQQIKITIFMCLCIPLRAACIWKKPPLILTGDRLVGRERAR